MALQDVRCAWVNRSGTKIPVYSGYKNSPMHTGGITVNDDKIGDIYNNEFYTLIPNNNYVTSYDIIFRDPNGVERKGVIETCPAYGEGLYAWVNSQEPYHYYNSDGTTLVESTEETISGKKYRIFTVSGSARTCRDSNGTARTSIPVGAKLATTGSTTGVTYGGYMYFEKKKLSGGSWVDCVSGGSSTYGFVDLGLSVGSFPSNRPIR